MNYCWATSLGREEKKPESITERGSQGTVIRASSSKGEFISSMVSPSWVFARDCYTQRAGWYERGALERKRAPDAGQNEERFWNVVMLGEIRFSVVSSDARRERPGFIMVLLAPQQSISLGALRITYLPDGEFFIPPSVLYPHASAEHWTRGQYR